MAMTPRWEYLKRSVEKTKFLREFWMVSWSERRSYNCFLVMLEERESGRCARVFMFTSASIH